MDELFDAAAGLPLHVLVVHGVVVGIPLMALVTVAVASRTSWREKASWLVVVANAGLLAMSWVATQSGEQLRDRKEDLAGGPVATITKHADRGDLIPYFVLGLLAASLLVAVTRKSPALRVPGLLLTVLAGAAAIYWTVLTGHSGSMSVWGGLISSNP